MPLWIATTCRLWSIPSKMLLCVTITYMLSKIHCVKDWLSPTMSSLCAARTALYMKGCADHVQEMSMVYSSMLQAAAIHRMTLVYTGKRCSQLVNSYAIVTQKCRRVVLGNKILVSENILVYMTSPNITSSYRLTCTYTCCVVRTAFLICSHSMHVLWN